FSAGDFNGDGKMDFLYRRDNSQNVHVLVSTGSGFVDQFWGTKTYLTTDNGEFSAGDFNGDGKTDFFYRRDNSQDVYVLVSTGSGFVEQYWGTKTYQTTNAREFSAGDFNGDGKMDFLYRRDNSQNMHVLVADGIFPDLLTTISNGLGGTTTLEYKPSTQYTNTQLPYPVQTLSKIITNDGNGHVSNILYDYAEGFHHISERDFRGFHYVKMTGQAGAGGEQTVSETWFHQGNDTAVDVNNPNVANGYLKGFPYRSKVKDGAGNLYSETTTTYQDDDNGLPPFFTPPSSVVNNICDGTSCGKQTRTDFTYDIYGNITREDQYGDTGTSTDDRTVTRTYLPNTTAWILGLPATEKIYQGLGTSVQVAGTDFYYDGTTSCSSPSSNQQPTKGNLTRVVKWLSGGTSPETRMAYDAYGNVTCTLDPRGNPTTLVYDTPSQTFAISATNALEHVTSTSYYGVNGVTMTTGLYGQVKTVTDPNGAVTTSEYDALGRRTKVTQPNGFWTTTAYNSFGTVGSQHVYSTSSLGLSSWTYFDGLGRTIKSRSTGPDSKIVVSEVRYDNRGAVTQQSLPVFEPATPTQWKTFLYDPLGRTLRATNPDASRGLYCYDDWVTVSVDANNHRRRNVSDAYGRILTTQEYTGTYATCDTSVGSPYATTTYTYDVLGNLKTVTDAKGNISTMTYDTLSRKTAMHDPDMGNWSYLYDAAGNLTRQTDAKSQNIYFQYDALNRRQQKDYGTQKALGSGNVNYVYDGATDFRTGRLQKVLDGAGITTFYYNNMGEVIRTDKAVSGVTYTTQTTYDGLGRVLNLTYPDLSVVTHTYNGPQLWQVKEGSTVYAAYTGFNAQGQPSNLTLGNGTATTYTYDPNNYRLKTLMTEKAAFTIQNLTYTFDAGGNITTLADPMPGHKNQTFVYDALDRLTSAGGPYGGVYYTYDQIGNMLSNSRLGSYTYPASGSSSVRPHAVATAGGNTYTYDANGNMTGGAGRTISYDYENRPVTIGAETLAGPEWIMKGAGDTDGDSKTDLVWRNASTGDAAIWRMNGTTRISAGIVASPGQTLDIKGVGDVDGDGKADLIWRDSNTGTVTIWLMNGATVTTSGVAGGVGLNWTIQGIGDTNGDGKADIVWRDTSGTTAIWLMNGTTMSSAGYPGGAGLNWVINGVGDTNGDGKADLVWRDTNSGATAIWFMNGTTMSSAGYPGGAGLDWSITNVGDTNGDGKADLVWRHTNGTVSVWLLNGASVQQTGQPGAAGMEWAIKSVGDVDGDGKGDLIWQNTTTGLTTPTSYIWVLNGTTVQSFNGQAPWWVPGPTTTTYVYDGDGGRVKKTVGSTMTTYIGKLYVCEGTSCAKMIFAGGQRIAIKQVNSGSTSYFHPDHLGSTSLLTNSSGVKEEDVVYYPFGETYTNTGTANVAYKYTGKELDSSTGLYFYEARYYDAVLGRFISADTIVPNATDPQAFNRYTYANNNPILYNDPTGHLGIKSIKKGLKKVSRSIEKKLGPVGSIFVGVTLQFNPQLFALTGGLSFVAGTAHLTQSKEGRYVLAGEIIVGTAVASWYCGGCAAQPALLGEVTLGTTGALSAAANGQDISKGLLIGTVIGGATGAFTGYFAPTGADASSLPFISKITLAGKVGFIQGFSEELTRQLASSGGNFGSLQPLKLGLGGIKGAGFRALGAGSSEFFGGISGPSTNSAYSITKDGDEIVFKGLSELRVSYGDNLAAGLGRLIEPTLPTSLHAVRNALPLSLLFTSGFDLADVVKK
ncbi:MAG: FG-GAP-like repeat-containing protein, partial [Nitrospirales bacterium]